MSKNRAVPESHSEKAARDNRANQLNPNNYAYWSSRGYTDEDQDRMEESR